MRHVLKASFERFADARQLLDALLAAGYAQAELGMSGATHAGPYTRRQPAISLARETGVLSCLHRAPPI